MNNHKHPRMLSLSKPACLGRGMVRLTPLTAFDRLRLSGVG